MASIALFSVSDQTHCALVELDPDSLEFSIQRVFNIHRSGYTALLLHGYMVPREAGLIVSRVSIVCVVYRQLRFSEGTKLLWTPVVWTNVIIQPHGED